MEYTTVWQDEILMSRAETGIAETVVCAEKSDAQLVELVLAGDETAFENIFDRYKRLVARSPPVIFGVPNKSRKLFKSASRKYIWNSKISTAGTIFRWRAGSDESRRTPV